MFINEAPIDFTIPENRAAFQCAVDQFHAEISTKPKEACPIISGEHISTNEKIESVAPSNPQLTVAVVQMADKEHVSKAFDCLRSGFHEWRNTSPEARSNCLRDIANKLKERRNQLSAIIVFESGKPWKEADADVVEAIDFCNYYAEKMLELGSPKLTSEVLGEDNFCLYEPRGISVVIAPWNFPLAIACGMTVASLVTGNCTILKPAQQSSYIAYELAKIILESGVPKNAFAFLPGRGGIIGREIVSSPYTDIICFTGSKEVGLEISKVAGNVQPNQWGIKKVICEMGGKNAIIVDEDADLDEAIKGILYSAFGYAGQKCSACSRVIVVGDAYQTFLERLKEAVPDLIIGDSHDPSSFVGPVIDDGAFKRISSVISSAEKDEKLLVKSDAPSHGFFIPPTVFYDVPESSPLWTSEIFGPVLACAQAETFEAAVELANNSSYALTGGLFSRSPANIEYAKRHFTVGNLYINRGCTGAIVCRQPFGGFRMSGVGTKAGGPEYLLHFMVPRTITENTMRRGFAPGIST